MHVINSIYPVKEADSINGFLSLSLSLSSDAIRSNHIDSLITKFNISMEKLYDTLASIKALRISSTSMQNLVDSIFNISAIESMMDTIVTELRVKYVKQNPMIDLMASGVYYDSDTPIYYVIARAEEYSVYKYKIKLTELIEKKKNIAVFNRPIQMKEAASNKVCPCCDTTLPIGWMKDEKYSKYGTCSEKCEKKFRERFGDRPIKCHFRCCKDVIHPYDIDDLGYKQFCSYRCYEDHYEEMAEFHRSDWRD